MFEFLAFTFFFFLNSNSLQTGSFVSIQTRLRAVRPGFNSRQGK